MSDWDVGVQCDIYVGVIVWSVKAFHNHAHSLPVVLLKSVYVWILICGKCMHSSSFEVWGSRQLWLDSAFLSYQKHVSVLWVACYLTLQFVCGSANVSPWFDAPRTSMWTSPLRVAALDLWDSHPAPCVCHVPPFETLMAPAECVAEWVGDNRAGPAGLRPAFAPGAPCIPTPGEDNTLHVLFLNRLLWPHALQSCHLI